MNQSLWGDLLNLIDTEADNERRVLPQGRRDEEKEGRGAHAVERERGE